MAVADILQDMGLGDIPRLFVLNKWDAVPEDMRQSLRNCFPTAIMLSAKSREGLGDLTQAILKTVRPGPGVRQESSVASPLPCEA